MRNIINSSQKKNKKETVLVSFVFYDNALIILFVTSGSDIFS